MDQIAYIEEQLSTFKDSLTLYREQTKTWYAQIADKGSHATDMPSLLGMERVLKVGNTSTTVASSDGDFMSSVARCPANGILEIESKFESVYDIPVGNLQVEVIPIKGGASTTLTLDAQGKARHQGKAGELYRVRVQSAVTSGQVDALFSSYDGLSRELETWLRGQWAEFKPQWSVQSASSSLAAAGNGILEGSWLAVKDVWDGIMLFLDILQDPMKHVARLGESAQKLADLAKQAPEMMEKAMLLASDEAALFLLLRTASLWLSALPPSQIAGTAAKEISRVLVSILIDILLALVLSIAVGGSGLVYLGMRLKKYGEKIVKAVQGFVEAIFNILKGFMAYVDKYKQVAARGLTAAQQRGVLRLQWDGRRNTTLSEASTRPDASRTATTPNGKPADTAKNTCTNNCPVSMVTGEELLTLTDGELDGLLPFPWTRLYRTSAAEIDSGLGYGWSHSLSHRLVQEDDSLVWIDHENRRTAFPIPNAQRPAITNRLSRAAIYLGDDPAELILAAAGDTP
ncbi:type IV secretion protein Rhs, partial [Pseudomonas sp. PIC25]|uniref:DUF6531 domain-containing protein n=1 Tax=Pseudomonas sp. PIC25 TaxID=1958773 RepID=UPI000BC7BDB2